MDFHEVVVKRRSVRKFREDAFSHEALCRILEDARWAPSAGNSQPWHFIVVTSVEAEAKIAGVCTEYSRKAWSALFLTFRIDYACNLRNGVRLMCRFI